MTHPTWSYDAVIYEVNIRQYTKEGTFTAFEKELPRLADLGITVLWFMPIFPIGKVNRKGSLGSYYSIRDYTAVNPEFGTLSDFGHLVERAHQLGLKVILDIATNHTAWDSKWLAQGHTDWYEQDANGHIISPFDWSDTAKLNYSNAEMRKEMIRAMSFWITSMNVDGFRQDMAGLVPLDFWEECIQHLRKLNPDLYMLGEVEDPEYQKNHIFDITYRWKLFHFMEDLAKGTENVTHLRSFLEEQKLLYKNSDMGLLFTSNHDENSWNDTEFIRFGKAYETFAALTYVLKGTPLIYSGQEFGSKKKLEFFEKDLIDRNESKYTSFYKTLNHLKHNNKALQDGEKGGELIHINSSQPYNVLAFKRKTNDNIVIAIFNLTPYEIQPAFWDEDYNGIYNKLWFEKQQLYPGQYDPFGAWEYKIYYKNL